MLWTMLAAAWAGALADAVAAGDCATLVQRTDPFEAQVERWRLPRAWCLLRLGDTAGAARMLEVDQDGVVGSYARLVRARALLALDDPEGARRALDGLELPGAAGEELRRTRAALHAEAGEVEAVDRALGDADRSGEAQLLRARARDRAGRADEATALLRQLWTEAELGGADQQAAAMLEARGAPAFTAQERSARLTALRRRGRVEEAADLADALAAEGAPVTPIELARVQLAARRYEASLASWQRALGPPADAAGGAEALFDYALTWARTGDYATAAVVYRRLMQAHPGHSKADFASYKLGYMAYDEGDCAGAVPLLEAHMGRYPSSKHLDEALWFAARCHWRAGNVDAAVAAWQRLERERPRSSLVPGAVYWRARAAERAGDADGARAQLERVVRSWPVSGYAWFAAHRLGRRFEPRPVASRPAWPAALASRPEVQRADTLMELGFRDWALDELGAIERHASGREAALAAAWALAEAGAYRRAVALARPHCVSPWKGGDPLAQQICTPRPEAGIVAAIAARFDLHPLLPFGIMTAESALDPKVTSPAGARGLMQLMPAEGPRVHANLYPERPFDADDLYSAPYNASMGTAELGLRNQSLAGVLEGTDLPAVIASYNGGEEAVRRWLEAYESPPPFDEFAEDIGYTETRKYVKRVLGFVMAYRWVYGDAPP